MEFVSAEAAKAAVDETAKSLVKGEAHVTEDEAVVAVKENGANGELINAFIEKISVAEGSNIVTVKMFSDLKEDTVYTVLYGGKEYSFKACKWIPAVLKGSYGYTANPDETPGGTAELSAKVYAIGDQGQNVDITAKVDSIGSTTYENTAKEPDYSKYSFAGDRVDFYQNGVTVNVKATFTWYVDNTESNIYDVFDVTTRDQRRYKILGYEVTDKTDKYIPAEPSKANVCYGDPLRYLLVKIGVDDNGDGVYDNATIYETYPTGTDETTVTFKSSNVDKLNIDEKFGTLYAPKAVNDTVNVYVYYKDNYVGAIPVKVLAKRAFTELEIKAKDDNTKYSYSEDSIDTDLIYHIEGTPVEFTITAKDQLGEAYSDVTIDIVKTTDVLDGAITCTENTSVGALVKGDTTTGKNLINSGDKLSFSAETTSPAVKTVQYKVTATENVTNKQIVKVFSFTVKNTTKDTVVRTQVVDNGDDTFSVFGMSSAGYRVHGYHLTNKAAATANDKLVVEVVKADTGKIMDVVVDLANTKVAKLTTKWSDVDKSFAKATDNTQFVTTGAAIDVNLVTTAAIHKGNSTVYLENGTYQVKALQKNTAGNFVIKNAITIKHENKIPVDTFLWTEAYSEDTVAVAVLNESFQFNVATWEDTNKDGTEDSWVTLDGNKKLTFENAAKAAMADGTKAFVVSYIENPNGSITYMNLYRLLSDDHIVVTPIRRTVYTGVQK